MLRTWLAGVRRCWHESGTHGSRWRRHRALTGFGDPNVIVALADRSDTGHASCRDWLEQETEPLVLPMTVLAESCYLIDRFGGPASEARFLNSVGSQPTYRFHPVEITDTDLRRMAELVRQYADRRLGAMDASLVAVAERLAITTITTMNRRDFDNVRPSHVPAFTIVPH